MGDLSVEIGREIDDVDRFKGTPKYNVVVSVCGTGGRSDGEE